MDFWRSFGIRPSVQPSNTELIYELKSGDLKIHELSADQKGLLDITIAEFLSTAPDKLGCTPLIEHCIDTGNAKAVKVRARPISPYLQAEMNIELDRMLRLGIIENAEPTEWAHPVVCVRKPSGKIRFCLDARRLNEVTVKDTYPLPYINRILGRLAGTKYLSSIDLSDAFWQVRLNSTSRPKTAFIVPGRGLFQYNRMPFGLCNASQTLCRLMDKVLGVDLEPKVFVYLDDIIVTSQTFEEHVELLKIVAKRLRDANLTISREKSRFCLTEIKYLGYVLDEHGLRVDPEKVMGILNFATPTSVKEVRRLLGLAGWYRRFIAEFSSVTAPISNLLKKSKGKFIWTVEAQEALTKLKALLISAPILVNPDFEKPFVIQTDASDTGIGAVLTQKDENGERVIAYMSQKLTCTQKKYPATERECLAVVLAIEKFRPYIEGVKFQVITDCASLIWLRNIKDPASRLARWSLRLQQYDFDLTHRKGRNNVVPDALSRSVDLIEAEQTRDEEDVSYQRIKSNVQNEPEKYPDYCISEGKLYKHCKVKDDQNNFQFDWRLYIHNGEKTNILRENHDMPLAAHQGYWKTLKRIQTRYFWPGMSKDVRQHIKSCEKCQLNKYPSRVMKVPIENQRITSRPWEQIAVDYMGPYPRSKTGNQHLIVVIDTFTKFVLLKAVRRAEVKSLCKFLEEEVFLIFGVPKYLVSDNGSQFVSKEFARFMDAYGVTHWRNAAYHAQANPAERVNRSILAAVRSYIQEDQRTWDVNIPQIACALRSATHESTKYSPYCANFGREFRTSGRDVLNDSQLEQNVNTDSTYQRMSDIGTKIQANLTEAYKRYSRHYNLRTRPRQFEVGQTVLKKSFKQ